MSFISSTDHVGLQLLIFVGIIFFLLVFAVFFIRQWKKVRELLSQKYFVRSEMLQADESYRQYLSALPYFANLSDSGKHIFIARLKKILSRLQFSTEGPVEADEEKRILIAAPIVQITFGLKEYDIDTIEYVKVFADDIYNPKTKVRYKGLTYLNGNMYLSWKYFLEGLRVSNDGINLGLHETGHGLYILLKQYRGYDDFDDILKVWYDYAYHDIDHKEEGKEFFRKYADANLQEFFAICIENFFERPEELRRRLPVIYGQLATFLNQDPLNKNDYEYVAENIPAAAPPSEKLYLYKNRPHPSQGFLLWASGLSVVAMVFMKAFFLETLFNLILYSIPCMLISYNLLRRFYLLSKRMSRSWYFVFCFVAVNPLVFVVFLLLNLFVSSGINGSRTYKVNYIEPYSFGVNQNDLTFTSATLGIFNLEGNSTVPIERRVSKNGVGVREIEYTYHYGITGFKVFDGVTYKAE